MLEPPVVVPLPRWLQSVAFTVDYREDLANSYVEVVLDCGGGEVEGFVASLDGVVKLLAVNFEALPVLALVVGVAVDLDGQLVLLQE